MQRIHFAYSLISVKREQQILIVLHLSPIYFQTKIVQLDNARVKLQVRWKHSIRGEDDVGRIVEH